MTPAFNKILSDALKRRMHPNTGLHSDQLAYALGLNGDTVRAWMRGDNVPNGAAISELLRFFYSAGDYRFAIELFGEGVTPLTQRAKLREAYEAVERAREALEAVA